MMTIDRQIEDMATSLSQWKATRIDERTASWEGELQPYNTGYHVRIEHTVPSVIEYRSLLYLQPLIEIITPRLRRRPGNAEGSLPHVYWSHPRTHRPGPFLCVFDAKAREWSLSDPLATTTVPFTLHWLQSYEGWLATGRWLGLGRHSEEERTGEPDYKQEPGSGADSSWNALDGSSSLAPPATTLAT